MKTLFAFFCAAFLGAAGSAAAAPVPGDFAYGMELAITGSSPLGAVTLPDAVYRGVTRGDLADLRVFNASGEAVPHQLRRIEAAPVAAALRVLPLFPVYGSPAQKQGLFLEIRTDDAGAIAEVRTAAEAADLRVLGYLLDASRLEAPVAALELDWPPSAQAGVTPVRVEGSDDLEHWRQLGEASVVGLRYGGHDLRRSAIPLEAVRTRYLRLVFPGAPQALPLTAVSARLAGAPAEPPRRWASAGDTVQPQPPGEFILDVGGRMPVDRARVQLSEANTLVQVRLFSRATEQVPWQPRQTGLAYRLRADGEELTGPDLEFPPVSDRYWLLRVEGGLGSAVPRLELGWLPHRLLFLARGEGPFTLAYGSARLAPADVVDGELLAHLTKEQRRLAVATAVAGAPRVLGGEAMLRPPAPPLPWKKWLLWSTLLLGVALMAAMAVRLYRQLERQGRDKAG